MPRRPHDLTPDEARARVGAWLRALPDVLARVARAASARWGGRAVGTYMRQAKGEPPRRRMGDAGPLRVVRGRVARAVGQTADGRSGAVNRIRTESLRATLTKGVDARVAPGAYNEGRQAKSGRDLSFLAPALNDEQGAILSMARGRVQRSLRASLRGQPTAGGGPTGGDAA